MANPKSITTNTLYFGDNLDILRQHIAGGSVEALRYPDLSRGSTSFKKAKIEEEQGDQPELL